MKWNWGRADWSRVFYVSLVFAVVLVPAALIHVLYRLWGGPLRVSAVVLVPAFMTVVVALISFLKARGVRG